MGIHLVDTMYDALSDARAIASDLRSMAKAHERLGQDYLAAELEGIADSVVFNVENILAAYSKHLSEPICPQDIQTLDNN
jgi:hypothetical protein